MMPQMTVLKELYQQQKTNSFKTNAITSERIGMSIEEYHTALKSLKEHGYITNEELTTTPIKLTQKGCILAKELYTV